MSSEIVFNGGHQVLTSPGVPLLAAGATVSSGGTSGGSGGTSGGTSGGSGGTSGGSGSISAVEIVGGGNQSNWNYAFGTDGAVADLAQAVGFYLSASYSALTGYANDGIGLFNLTTPSGSSYTGSYVNNNDYTTTLQLFNDTRFGNTNAAIADAAVLAGEVVSATVGTAGASYQTTIAALTSGQISGASVIVCYWGETDSLQFTPINRALFKACVVRWMALVRAMFGKTAAQLPFVWFGPPYGPSPALPNGPATIREIWAEVAADPAQNAVWVVPQTYDTMSRSGTQNPATGLVADTLSDVGHRAAASNVALFKRAAIATARAIVAANGLSGSLVPSALGSGLGPRITGVSISGTTLTLTVTHDGGSDLAVPLLASAGVGFSVMDGGSVASPGTIIQATACARVDATHLTVTLASAPTSSAGNRRLFYPWPQTYSASQPYCEIGPACAVADNFATVTKPSGFDIDATLGVGWAANMPLQPPVTVTGTGPSATAEWGIAF